MIPWFHTSFILKMHFEKFVRHSRSSTSSLPRLRRRLPLPDWKVRAGLRHRGRVVLPVHWERLPVHRPQELQAHLHGRLQLRGRLLRRLQRGGHDAGASQERADGRGLRGSPAVGPSFSLSLVVIDRLNDYFYCQNSSPMKQITTKIQPIQQTHNSNI